MYLQYNKLRTGEKGVIVKVMGRGAFRKRIIEMGFIRGKMVDVIQNAPLKDPIHYKVMGYDVSLRRSDAALIEVVSETEFAHLTNTAQQYTESLDADSGFYQDTNVVFSNTRGIWRSTAASASRSTPPAGTTKRRSSSAWLRRWTRCTVRRQSEPV